ncbi:type II secretion system F family protein [Bifidobacterium avesanii]|uniref:Pilus assembly protein n=1 Tax=Bifidobacterium avesanii TaxID=1798157 RepID=A0A7K3TF90_9BIFI|nr:type II secretion system F family protein [Bifidobacterium avesanii]NEG77767.1 hypothetical protein [Bifidobacterium avesanii]
MAASAALAGCAVRLWQWRDDRTPGDAGGDDAAEPSVSLILEMLAVAIRQGASIPRALDAVGGAWGGPCGSLMIHVADVLHRGSGWRSAWAVACADPRFGALMTVLEDTLEPAWRHGSSPLPRIEAAVEQRDRDERRIIEEAAARMGVRMLVPMGLCFLPSFIVIGVVPAIASFGAGLFG